MFTAYESIAPALSSYAGPLIQERQGRFASLSTFDDNRLRLDSASQYITINRGGTKYCARDEKWRLKVRRNEETP